MARTRTASYEIGTITKTFPGLLLADAIQRGEVTADTRLGALLPLAGAPVADVTLGELASHGSGLSAQGMQLDERIPSSRVCRCITVHVCRTVMACSRSHARLRSPTAPTSCIPTSGQRLGQALAAAAHSDYVTLVQQRVLTPLGMSATTLPLTASDLPPDAPTASSGNSVAEAPWTIGGWPPARARALLDGSAPGIDALKPQWTILEGAQQIGMAGTYGRTRATASHLRLVSLVGSPAKSHSSATTYRAVIVLSNTLAEVHSAADGLLAGDLAWAAAP